MKRKSKLSLIINISVICLCVCAIAIGVYSVKNASLSVSGTIGFNAHDCEMLIKGTMQGYESSDNGTTTTAVTKYFNKTGTASGEALTVKDGTNNSWALGTLYFDDLHTTGSKQVNDIIFTFEITNNSDFYVDVTVNQDFLSGVTNGDRIFVYAPNNGETLSPRTASDGKSVTLTIKLQLQKDANGEYSKLDSLIDLSNAKSLLNFKKIDSPAYLAKDYVDKLTAGFTGFDKTEITKLSFVNELKTDSLTGFVTENNAPKGVSVADTTKTETTDVLGYWNSTTQEVIIYSPARLYAPTDCSSLMAGVDDYEEDFLVNLMELNLFNFDTSSVTNMDFMFSNINVTMLDVSNLDTSCVELMGWLFNGVGNVKNLDIRNFNTSNVTNMQTMFHSCSSLSSLNLSNFDTSNVTSMSSMFCNCSSLTSLDLSNFDTSNVTNMSLMFDDCSSLTALDVSGFNTSKVTNMICMFWGCVGLTTINVSGFDTSNVTDMSCMFACLRSASLDLSNFDTSKVTDMSQMFRDGLFESLDLSNFNTSNVTYIEYMFENCSNLTILDLSGFNTSNVTHMSSMFASCSSLTTIFVASGWNTSKLEYGDNIFTGCTSLVGGTNGTVKYDPDNANNETMANYTTGYLTLKTA